MATKSRPMSAPATPALAAKKAEKLEGTNGTESPLRSDGREPDGASWDARFSGAG
jgi:hypothetical protein